MPANLGGQTVTIKYYDPIDSYLVNTRHEVTRPIGIYKGGYLTITNAATSVVSLSALVCEISDGTYQVRVETVSAVSKTLIKDSAEYVILRWTYTGATDDYMEILVTNNPTTNDIIVGKGVWTGVNLTNIIYTERTSPDQMRYFLKVEAETTPSVNVRIRPGRAHTGSSFQAIADQTMSLSAYKNKTAYIYINDTGGVAVSATASAYAGMALLAKVTVPGSGIVTNSCIEDARCFVDSPAIPDGTTIERNSVGKLQIMELGVQNSHINSNVVDGTTIEKDAVTGKLQVGFVFGTRVTTDTDSAALVKTVVYRAECDGFLFVQGNANNANIIVTSDKNNPPVTIVGYVGYGYNGGSIHCPIKKNDYVEVNAADLDRISWLPIGTGGLKK
ncbi:MAG: hypothetical protein ACTSUP_09755 [Candidatus Heimdallarchaeaceae archaeon]